jgi:hypothetical protein
LNRILKIPMLIFRRPACYDSNMNDQQWQELDAQLKRAFEELRASCAKVYKAHKASNHAAQRARAERIELEIEEAEASQNAGTEAAHSDTIASDAIASDVQVSQPGRGN